MTSGPFQTAVNQMLGMAAGSVAAVKKYVKDERQASEKAKETADQDQKKAIEAFNKEEITDLRAEAAAKAYREAQQRGLDKPRKIIFDEAGQPLASSDEMAQLLADTSLNYHLDSRKRTMQSVSDRKKLLIDRGNVK